MNINTFINIYYKHRLKKASNIFVRSYIFLTIPFAYLLEKINYQKYINLDEYQKDNKILFNKNLNYLFQYFNSDKGDRFINQYTRYSKRDNKLIKGHKYSEFYEKFFKNIKKEKLDIFEIGSFKGNTTASLFFYFKNSIIHSADLYPDIFCYSSKRIKNFKLDSSSSKDLSKISKKMSYDIIIEDAGHYLKDQIISLFKLFSNLKKNGIFIIEELDFPDTRKDMNQDMDKNTLYNILKLIIKKKDFHSKFITTKEKEFFLKNVKKINIYNGRFNKIAFIRKK
tara:strand:- start:59 stop:904 length:846 start_codon:yes stop_codon:yes gene_type:complete